MAAEYEIREIGFIGSAWQGDFGTPINVGKTFQVLNVPNTIELGGVDPKNLGKYRVSIHFTEQDQLDIRVLNKQLPSTDDYFEIGKLPSNVIEELYVQCKISKEFLQKQDVLFLYNKRREKQPIFSSIPVQENWSFDTTELNNVKYIYNDPNSIFYVNFTFLTSAKDIQSYIDYFLRIEQVQSIFDSPIIASPPSSNEPDPLSDLQFDLVETVNTFLPPKPESPRIFVLPPADMELLAEERAKELFDINKPRYVISNIAEFNEKLQQAEIFIKAGEITFQENNSNARFTDAFNKAVQIKLFDYIRNYLYQQISLIEQVSVPTVDPTRWSVDETGFISIEPAAPVLPQSVTNQLSDDTKDLQEFDELIDDIIDNLTIDENNIYVYKKVTKVADYSLPIQRYKTSGLFKCTGEKLSTYYTGSLTSKQQKYYTSIFNQPQGTTDSYHQFDITYCHISGSGSSYIEGELDYYPAKTMYRKYMLECFGNTEGKFPFKNGKNGEYFYAIQLDRNQYKEKLDTGNFELALCELSASGTLMHPTSTRFFTLIDESLDSKQQIVTNEGIQEFYYVTSGSLRDGVYNESSDDAWGIVFPKMGLIILDGVVLDQSCSFSTVTSSIDGQNTNRLFLSISGAAVPTSNRPSGSFFARSFETFLTETYFCRADFNEFNTSTNYTYISGSNGFMKYDYFSKEPQSFITTIGLYNKRKELLAVGKLRNPIRKNDGRVCVFEVVVRLN